MNKIYKTPLTAMALIMSTVSFNVMADDMNELTGWQTPLAAEFSKLDTTGNGLLLPHEASKNRAFNKKTFAQADVDRDGYIDQNEYIHFKTGEWPATVQAKQLQPSQVQPNQEPANMDQSDADQPSAESSNSMKMTKELSSIESAAQQAMLLATQNATTAVSDDTVITHKAIATLLSTEELEGMKISVETYLGEVLLSGVVESQKDKMKAAYVVSKVDGVKSVKNELQVMS